MRCTSSMRASLSASVYLTRRAFEKQLNTSPTTAFHYYCQLDHRKHDPQLKRYMRREWEMLSITKKRLYYAFYFHFKNVNYKKMNKFELAKFLEIPTPATSEYMLFRNTFKCKFEIAWIENIRRQRIAGRGQLIKQSAIAGGHRLSVYTQQDYRQLKEEATNYASRYRQMCKECRRVWTEKVTLKQKIMIRRKWEEQRQIFEERIVQELEALEANLNRLTQVELRQKCFLTEDSCGEPLKKK